LLNFRKYIFYYQIIAPSWASQGCDPLAYTGEARSCIEPHPVPGCGYAYPQAIRFVLQHRMFITIFLLMGNALFSPVIIWQSR
jgi:hypothetical protein